MCFSAEASFAAGAALLPVGAFCVVQAVRKDVRLLPLALTPIAFGVQQAAEGCVWLGLRGGDPALVARASMAFLFFAVAFWPFWIPFCLLFPESRPAVRRLLGATAALSVVWLLAYASAALEPGRLPPTEIVRHSISYDLSGLPMFRPVPRVALRSAYLAFIVVPLAAARPGCWGGRLRLLGGAAVAVLFALCYLIYWYAFLSVWCFFAALLSLLLGVAFYRLPARSRTATVGRGPDSRRAE